jgi:hypothetical protein
MKRVALWSALVILPLVMGAASFGLYPAKAGNTDSPADCCVDPNNSDQRTPDCPLTVSAKDSCPECECCPDCLSCCTDTTAKAGAKKDVCPPCPLCP